MENHYNIYYNGFNKCLGGSMIYFSVNNIQNKIDELKRINPDRNLFIYALRDLYKSKIYLENIDFITSAKNQSDFDYEGFFDDNKNLYIPFEVSALKDVSCESSYDFNYVDDKKSVTCIYPFFNLPPHLHKHKCFEIIYIYKGSSILNFENTKIFLEKGDFCIISPDTEHDFYTEDLTSKAFPIMVNVDTFYTTFISLLNLNHILGNFFKEILTNKANPNYLIFHTGANKDIQYIAKKLFYEPYRFDMYTNDCCVEWLKLLFSYVLRGYRDFEQYYNHSSSNNFSDVILYINKNYRTVSLNDVANKFNYSRTYLSLIIKQMTGMSYTDLIKRMKMEEAKYYLENSDKSVEEISFLVGYHSSDHFSRTFRSFCGMPPQKYKKTTSS